MLLGWYSIERMDELMNEWLWFPKLAGVRRNEDERMVF